MLNNSRSNMAIKSRKGQRRSREGPSNQNGASDQLERIAALKQGSKRSVSSESSGSKLSGTAGLDTEFDLDKHRDYDIQTSRRIYEENEQTPGSSSLTDDNLTDEQKAWAGIDAILDDNHSLDPEQNVLSEEIMAALHYSPGGENDDDDDDDDDSEDSHQQAMKMLCGLKDGEESDDLPGLMNSSFSSQFSQESARSVLSYLSRNNIIVQRDIKDGPLKSFLTDMAFSLERDGVVEEGEEEEEEEEGKEKAVEQDVDFDDDETDIHLIFSDDEEEDGDEDEPDSTVQEPPNRQEAQPEQKEFGALDPIGQQIINAIMTEMKRMKESDEYDEDDPNPEEDDYTEEEYDDDQKVDNEDEEYYEEEVDEEYEIEPETPAKETATKQSSRSPKQSPKHDSKSASPKPKPLIDPRDLPEINDSGFVPEDDLNNSIPSLDTFQDDEVCKILGHQNPMAWASFGDLHFDSNHVAQQRELPPTPFNDGELDGQYSPVSPVRSVKNEIVSGVVGAPVIRGEPQSPPSQPSPTKPKRQQNPKSPLKKKKKPVAAGGAAGGMRRSMVRPEGGPTATPRPKNPAATPKVLRKSVTRPDGTVATPKLVRKPTKRPDGTTATPKMIRKSISRPDGTGASPNTMRKSVSRQSNTRSPSQVKKSMVRQSTKKNPSSNKAGEGEGDVRRSVRKVKPNPDLNASQSGLRMSVVASEGENAAGTPQNRTKKKNIKVSPSEEKKRRSIRKVRPPSTQ